MQDPASLKMMAAFIAAGVVQIHGTTDAAIAQHSITLAREIDRQVDALGLPDENPHAEAPPVAVHEPAEQSAA